VGNSETLNSVSIEGVTNVRMPIIKSGFEEVISRPLPLPRNSFHFQSNKFS